MRVYKRQFFGGGIASDEEDYKKIEPEQGKIVIVIVDYKVFGETKEQHLEVYDSIMKGKLVYDGTKVNPLVFTYDKEFTIVDKHSLDYIDDICSDICEKTDELKNYYNEHIEEAYEKISNNYMISNNLESNNKSKQNEIINAIDNIE